MEFQEGDILRILKEIVVPMVESDGGKLLLVSVAVDQVTVHITGRLAGTPGLGLFCRKVLEPAIHSVAPTTRVVLTAGRLIPPGATDIA
jgi:hypothetical protein